MDNIDAGPLLACLFCTQNCYRTHGEGQPPGRSVPAFCKIMTKSIVTKDINNSVLELPAAFVKQYSHELHKSVSVTLEGPSGQNWSVDVCRSKCSMSFEKGWHSFSIDHDLREGDIAVFKLTTRAYFIVQVFDKDGCEKDLYSVHNSVALAMQSEIGCAKKCRKQIPQNILTERRYKHVKHEKVANVSHVDVESKEPCPNSGKEALQSTFCFDAAVTENRKNKQRSILKESLIQNTVDSHADELECDLQHFSNRYKNGGGTIYQEDAVGSSCMSQTSLNKDISLDSYKEETVFGTRQRHNSSRGGSNTWPSETSISCVRLVSDAMVAAKSHCANYPATIILMKYSHVTHGFSLNLGKDFAMKWLPEDDRCISGKLCWKQMEGQVDIKACSF